MSSELALFVPAFLAAFVTNLSVAGSSLAVGLAAGCPLALMRRAPFWLRWPADMLTGLLRAAPTFVVMFFLLNVMPHEIGTAGNAWRVSPELVLVLSLAVYAAGYVSDSGLDALRHLSAGSTGAALLFVPNMIRAFFVLVMASSTGAAIGVHEAVMTTLRQADRLTGRTDRIVLVLVVILFFTLVLQIANRLVRALTRLLTRQMSTTSADCHRPRETP